MKIFVGNLPSETTEDDLRQTFEDFGQITSVTIIKETGDSKIRGFGFVIMPSMNEAKNAIKKLHGTDFRGRKIAVEKSRTNTKARAGRRKRSRLESSGPTKAGREGRSGKRRGKRRH
jgi:RNA recognition motif-containing protein